MFRWEMDWGCMRDLDGEWVLDERGQALLDEGWKPFAFGIHAIYHPSDPPMDFYRERVLFRRRRIWGRLRAILPGRRGGGPAQHSPRRLES
jgi:hypothetical protein